MIADQSHDSMALTDDERAEVNARLAEYRKQERQAMIEGELSRQLYLQSNHLKPGIILPPKKKKAKSG